MHGLSIIDFHSPKASHLWALLSAQFVNSRNQLGPDTVLSLGKGGHPTTWRHIDSNGPLPSGKG